jgi:hypothetical protein
MLLKEGLCIGYAVELWLPLETRPDGFACGESLQGVLMIEKDIAA